MSAPADVSEANEPKRKLLNHFSDGAAHSPWGFGSGTISWAKKNGFIASVPGTKVSMYRITDAGRAERARLDGAAS